VPIARNKILRLSLSFAHVAQPCFNDRGLVERRISRGVRWCASRLTRFGADTASVPVRTVDSAGWSSAIAAVELEIRVQARSGGRSRLPTGHLWPPRARFVSVAAGQFLTRFVGKNPPALSSRPRPPRSARCATRGAEGRVCSLQSVTTWRGGAGRTRPWPLSGSSCKHVLAHDIGWLHDVLRASVRGTCRSCSPGERCRRSRQSLTASCGRGNGRAAEWTTGAGREQAARLSAGVRQHKEVAS